MFTSRSPFLDYYDIVAMAELKLPDGGGKRYAQPGFALLIEDEPGQAMKTRYYCGYDLPQGSLVDGGADTNINSLLKSVPDEIKGMFRRFERVDGGVVWMIPSIVVDVADLPRAELKDGTLASATCKVRVVWDKMLELHASAEDAMKRLKGTAFVTITANQPGA